MSEVTFPWPPRELSPNARIHWAAKARAVKSSRRTCWALALERKLSVDWAGPIEVRLIFHPPSNRGYDLDNAIASLKSCLDGLADALRVDDSRFQLIVIRGAKRPSGAVLAIVDRPQ